MTQLDERLAFDTAAFMETPRPTSYDNRVGTSLYVIKSEGFCKVGIAENVTKRLETFRAGNPHPLALVRQYHFNSRLHALLAERTVHKVLAPYSIGREWFELDPKLAANAAGHVTRYVKMLAIRWEREDMAARRADEMRYRNDPQFKAEVDAAHAAREAMRSRLQKDFDAVDEFRTNLWAEREAQKA